MLYANMPTADEVSKKRVVQQRTQPNRLLWHQILFFVYAHIAGIYGIYLFTARAMWSTILFNCATYYLSVLGAGAGAHRLWSHRSYKAAPSLQLFLMLCHSVSAQLTIFQWASIHRLHHKYSDTDADPHNSNRGFLYSHIGWLCMSKHPEVYEKKTSVDVSDLFANPVVMFQKRHQYWLNIALAFIIPTSIPIFLWSETFSTAYHVNMFRFILGLNAAGCANSLAHMFGPRPYDKNISPRDNVITTILTMGEGQHNYHHAFPYDYKTGEPGINIPTSFINFCAKLGLVYDLKEVSNEVLEQRMSRTGDSSSFIPNENIHIVKTEI